MRTKDSNFVIINLISSLVIVFIFILTYYFNDRTIIAPVKTEEIQVLSTMDKNIILDDLLREFGNDLMEWGAEIDRDSLSIRFNTDSALFGIGESSIDESFQNILNKFFPKYIAVLEKYRDDIEEIRIEGHTDAGWNRFFSNTSAYIKNMKLSQERTFSVFEYCLNLPEIYGREWLKSVLTTAGLSSSRPLSNDDTIDNDYRKNRRVEFKIILKLKSDKLEVILSKDEDLHSKNKSARFEAIGDNLLDNFDIKTGNMVMNSDLIVMK